MMTNLDKSLIRLEMLCKNVEKSNDNTEVSELLDETRAVMNLLESSRLNSRVRDYNMKDFASFLYLEKYPNMTVAAYMNMREFKKGIAENDAQLYVKRLEESGYTIICKDYLDIPD